MSLWDQSDVSKWLTTLAAYQDTVTNAGKARLPELDRWYQKELPERLKSEGKLTKEDLVRLVDWKLTRGKWRPRLLDFAKAAASGAVEDASLRAFTILSNDNGSECSIPALRGALAALTELKGVGPATATAVLSCVDSSVPFMSDEALLAATGSKEYTVAAAVKLMTALQRKAKELGAGRKGDVEQRRWTAREIEQCLFCEAALEKAQNTRDSKNKKRKR